MCGVENINENRNGIHSHPEENDVKRMTSIVVTTTAPVGTQKPCRRKENEEKYAKPHPTIPFSDVYYYA